ncbi:MAG TPA: OBAP family protein [Thermoanaerobaculia bacterium]|nr:OBAP family protein [Thermoanaerobaculia bacterium]
MKSRYRLLCIPLLLLTACGGEKQPEIQPPGRDTSAKTDTLKAGSTVLQKNSPFAGMDVYVVGFHPMKDDPQHQMEAHHFCRQVNEDFAQCALFDGNTRESNLNGIEYIISEKLFNALPAEEKQYWHPHNFEILSGELVAPGIPDVAEKELMRQKMNSYGKTWHVWSTNHGDELPFGPAMLAWSFNRDGEVDPKLMEKGNRTLGIDRMAKRRERQDLVPLAKPQQGVDVLKGKFPRPTKEIPGVVDAGAPPTP